MSTTEIFPAIFRELTDLVTSHILFSILGCFVLIIGLWKVYCRVTLGICYCHQDMDGKTILITGATAGIGKATAKDLAKRNARVILACRNMDKAREVAKEIISSTGNENIVVRHLDLSSFDSVRKCAEEVLSTEKKLHILINNAGIFSAVKRTTGDGYETVMQSNHLGHFLLTLLLLDLLKKSAPSRIINVSSRAYTYGKLDLSDLAGKNCKRDFDFYSRSKLANVLFTTELADKLAGSGVTVNTLCPGLVKTDIFADFLSLTTILSKTLMLFVGKTCEEGAQTTIYLAVHPAVENITGKFFRDCKEENLVRKALNKTLAKKLFEVSEKIVGISYQT